MSRNRERRILTEFLQLYKESTCLWDLQSDEYTNKNRRNQAWDALADKLRELEPQATVATAKKKINCFRTCYRREARRVEESKQINSGSQSVFKPSLWYYDMLSFIKNKEDHCSSELDMPSSDEESQEIEPPNVKSKTRVSTKIIKKHNAAHTPKRPPLDKKKNKLYKAAKELLQQDDINYNPFGLYVGEQLDQVATFQRQVAEKLISEIIFLARTKKLNTESKIESLKASQSATHSNYPISGSSTPNYI